MDTNGFGAASVAQTSKSISICPNRRRPSESLVLVLVIGNGTVEDEKEDEDDLLAALPRCAVSRVSKAADHTTSHAPPIWKSAEPRVEKPALRDAARRPP